MMSKTNKNNFMRTDTVKYNLTFWQKLELIPLWILWIGTDRSERRDWHSIKKGMEKHECKHTVPDVYKYGGREFKIMKCEHEGCNIVSPLD